ncbi:ImmA/IrrE family metallo-endopeptidase [Dehalogenimonas sp. THU2]|uniref:ImmA/IrrE family metallo-endopeptidase n=1 Tax=Dehalogenimonas sp. THU2 TaxID=3151121 RepID=UPI003218552D
MKSLNDLRAFCGYLARKYGSPSASSEEEKAEEFRRVYLKGLPSNLKALRAVASCCGLELTGLDKMPRNVRGYHEICNGHLYVYYRKDDTVSGIQNTILHEMREMMETLFAQADRSYEPLKTRTRHLAANRFATAVLLPEKEFRANAFKTGFDVVGLAQTYSKSYSQVLLRMGEILQGKLFFYGALFEPDDADAIDWAVTYWTISCNEDAEPNIYGIDGLFPKKGRRALPGSLVDMTVRSQKAHLVRRITLTYDSDFDDDELTAFAVPVVGDGTGIEKVLLVVFLARDEHLLEPQIKNICPTVVESFHRHL